MGAVVATGKWGARRSLKFSASIGTRDEDMGKNDISTTSLIFCLKK
jgi:hypothetical protein